MAKIGKSKVGINIGSNSTQTTAYATGLYMASENGTIDSVSLYVENTGIGIQLGVYSHAEVTYTITYSGGSGSAPAVGDIVTWTGGSGLLVTVTSGNNVAGVIVVRAEAGDPITSPVTIASKSWSATVDSSPGVVSSPARLVARTSGYQSVTTSGWQTISVMSPSGNRDNLIQKGKRYWIAFAFNGGASIQWRESYTEEFWWYNVGTSGGNLRDIWSTGGGANLYRAISAYFTYTPATPDPGDTSLQGRIDRAAPGATVRIPYGFYNETLRINKPIKLVGVADRRGRMPIIQGGELLTGWTLSMAPEHTGKNVWYKDIAVQVNGKLATLPEHAGRLATWVCSLQLDDFGVQILQFHPNLAGEGVLESGAASATNPLNATAMRNAVLERAWTDPTLMFIVASQTIDFWQWYDAIACHEKISNTQGRLWLRLNSNNPTNKIVNPNNHKCYATFTQNNRSVDNDDWNYTNELATVIQGENLSSVTVRGLEVRGGRWGIHFRNCDNVIVEKCKVMTPALRSIAITDCENVVIQKNEITSKRMRRNMHAGFGGTSDRARASMFGWSLNKNYSTSGSPSPAGHSIELAGVTSNVIIRRNWMHSQGGGIAWGFGEDVHAIDATIENNIFENMDSNAVTIYPRATGSVKNNLFYDVQQCFRSQGMMSGVPDGTSVTIENNLLHAFEKAGYLIQAHYAGVRYKVNFSGGSGVAPVVGDSVRFTGGTWNNFDRTIIATTGDNTSGSLTWYQSSSHANITANFTRAGTIATLTKSDHGFLTGDIMTVTLTNSAAAIPLGNYTVTVIDANTFTITCLNAGSTSSSIQYFPFARSVANLTTGWSANITLIEEIYTWTQPVVFRDNFVQEIDDFISNLRGGANVEMYGNVLDSASGFSSDLSQYGVVLFIDNWIGGNAGTASVQGWWGTGNDYVLNQRLVGMELPEGFEQKGPYRQNVGLPIKRRPKTYAEKING